MLDFSSLSKVNERHVDLLLIADDDTNHYCFIKDFGKLVVSQYRRTDKEMKKKLHLLLGKVNFQMTYCKFENIMKHVYADVYADVYSLCRC